MNTKLFNKTIIKLDFKRFWWVGALYLAAIALFILPDFLHCYTDGPMVTCSIITDEASLAFFSAFVLAGLIFGYLHRVNSVSCLHGMPVSRMEYFLSHCLSGIVILIIPVLIGCAVMAMEILYHKSLGHNVRLLFVLKYFYACVVYILLIFSVTALASIISGNMVAGYVFSFSFMLIPFFLLTAAQYIFCIHLYGYDGNVEKLINYLYIFRVENIWSYKSILYIAASVVFFVLAYVLYKKRHLENYGEVVAFPWIRPVFMYTAAICFGLFGYLIFTEIGICDNLFAMLPLGYIALTAAFMLNRKSFSPKGIHKPLIIYTVGVAAAAACFAFDLTGFEKRMPSENMIEDVSIYNYNYRIDMSQIINMETKENGYGQYYDYNKKPTAYNSNDINMVLNLHKFIIDNKDKADMDDLPNDVYLEYHLKNGKTFKRYYEINFEDMIENKELGDYIESDIYKTGTGLFDDPANEIISVNLDSISPNVFSLSKTDYDAVKKALKKDTDSFDKYDMIANVNGSTNGFMLNIVYEKISEADGQRYRLEMSQKISINNAYVNTMALILDELPKYSKQFLSTDELENLIVTQSIPNGESGEYFSNETVVEDKNDIADIYMSLLNPKTEHFTADNFNNMCDDVYLKFNVSETEFSDELAQSTYTDYEYSENSLTVYIKLPFDQIPEKIQKYLKK